MPDSANYNPSVVGASSPTERLGVVLRPALHHKGVWVSAQAGSGKSFAVASCLKHIGVPHVWYRLNTTNEAPQGYFRFLTDFLVQQAYLPSSDSVGWTYDSDESLLTYSRNYFRRFYALLPRQFVLVLDDCSSVAPDSSFWEIVRVALEECPEGKSLLMLSRQAAPELFSKEIAYGVMALIESSVFRLPDDVSDNLLQSLYPTLNEVERKSIAGLSSGWPMGLVMLGKQAMHTSGQDHLLFAYLSHEVMTEFSPDDRNILFQLACLPVASKIDAISLTRDSQVVERLDRLVHRCSLIMYTAEGYRLAPLFRDYLLKEAGKHLPPSRVSELFKATIDRVVSLNDEIMLFQLLVHSELWTDCEGYLASRADKLFSEGRSEVLIQWISGIPLEIRRKSPWMSYIEGRYLALQSDPLTAHEFFTQSMALFKQIDHMDGQALAWAGAVDALYRTMRDYAAMDCWIREVERMFPTGELPLNDAGRMVAQYGLVPMFLREPTHPFIGIWARRIENCIHRIKNRSQQILLAIPLIRYYSWIGSGASSRTLIESIHRPDAGASDIEKALWHNLQSMCCMFGGDSALSLSHADEALRLLPAQASTVARFRIMLCGGYAALENNDCRRATEYVDAMKAIAEEVTPFDEMQYHFIAGWVDLLLERHVASRARFEEAIAIARDCNIQWGAPFSHASIIHVLLAQNDFDAAECHLSQVNALIGKTGSRILDYFISITQAWYEIETGKESDGLKHLEAALTFAERENYTSNPWLTRAFLIKICIHALERQIEVPFVRRIIRELGLVPLVPPLHLDEWPWPIRIYTMGRFTVMQDDQPVQMTSKGHGKPMELLKLLIAMGGREVPKDKLIEILWPDLDGDFGQKSFDTAVYRLRKLVGSDKVIQVHGRMVSIDHHTVWLDIWALQRMVNKCRQKIADVSDRHISLSLAQQMAELYHADFFGDDTTYPVFEKKRRQLRKMFLECVIESASQYVYSGDEQAAIKIYQQVLNVLHDVPEIQTKYDALTQKKRVEE